MGKRKYTRGDEVKLVQDLPHYVPPMKKGQKMSLDMRYMQDVWVLKDVEGKRAVLHERYFKLSREAVKAKTLRYDEAYMKMAFVWSELSWCKRKKVGAIVVKDKQIISDGYNGTPTGMDNTCEDCDNNSHQYVLHAEANALMKLAKSTNSSIGATLYVTLSPCMECAKLILQSGIKRVVFSERYRDDSSILFLRKNGIEVEQINLK